MPINRSKPCSIHKDRELELDLHSHFQHYLQGQKVYSMTQVLFQQGYGLTPQLSLLHTPCGAYKPDYEVYACL